MDFRPPGAPTALSLLSEGPPPWIRSLVPTGASLVFYVTTTTDAGSSTTSTSVSKASTIQTTLSSITISAAPVSETRSSTPTATPTASPNEASGSSTGVSPVWIAVATTITLIVVLLAVIAFLLLKRRRRNQVLSKDLGLNGGGSENLRSELPTEYVKAHQLHGDDQRRYELPFEEKKHELDNDNESPISPLEKYGVPYKTSKDPPAYGGKDTESLYRDQKHDHQNASRSTEIHELDGRQAWYIPKNKTRPR